MHNCNVLRVLDIIVTAGTSVTIIIPDITLFDKRMFTLDFCLTRPQIEKLRLAQGTEPVFIRDGVSGSDFILEDCAGDIFYSNSLIPNYKYRIRFGNNGPIDETGTGALNHYININTPCCKRQIDPANGAVAVEAAETTGSTETEA